MSTPHLPADSRDGGSSALRPELRQALVAAASTHGVALDELRAAVCGYVEDLRARGVSAPDIAAAVRSRVAELRAAGRTAATDTADDRLLDQIVDWCTEAGASTP